MNTSLMKKLDGFEGPEKNLVVYFTPNKTYGEGKSEMPSLRNIPKPRWDVLLTLTACKILSEKKSKDCTAYVLSESSLFVFDDHVILKTCGTTRLLCGLDPIFEIGKEFGMTPHAVLFWRKSYTYPEKQLPPHTSFEDECKYLDERCVYGKPETVRETHRDSSSPDHWCFYMALLQGDNHPLSLPDTLEIKMHEVHPDTAKHFFSENRDSPLSKEVVEKVRNLVPNLEVDEQFFEPCGYSMNSISMEEAVYSTVHITPEAHCSYVSFETNCIKSASKTLSMVQNVLNLFRPACFTVACFGHSLAKIPNYDTFGGTKFTLCGIPVTVVGYLIKDKCHPLLNYIPVRTDGNFSLMKHPKTISKLLDEDDYSREVSFTDDEDIESKCRQWRCFKSALT